MSRIIANCIVASVLTAAIVSPAHADEKQFQIETSGVGVESCASYTLALRDNRPTAAIKMDGKIYYTEANGFTQWIVGFVNAANWITTSTNISTKVGKRLQHTKMSVDVNGVALWVKNYCEANPSASISLGAVAYVNAHVKK
jgi:hypothetical protein